MPWPFRYRSRIRNLVTDPDFTVESCRGRSLPPVTRLHPIDSRTHFLPASRLPILLHHLVHTRDSRTRSFFRTRSNRSKSSSQIRDPPLLPSFFPAILFTRNFITRFFEPTFVNTLHHLTRRAPLDLSFYFIPRVSFPVSNQSIQNRSQCRVTKQQQHARNFPFDTR